MTYWKYITGMRMNELGQFLKTHQLWHNVQVILIEIFNEMLIKAFGVSQEQHSLSFKDLQSVLWRKEPAVATQRGKNEPFPEEGGEVFDPFCAFSIIHWSLGSNNCVNGGGTAGVGVWICFCVCKCSSQVLWLSVCQNTVPLLDQLHFPCITISSTKRACVLLTDKDQ